jgi:prevent-host-death family protein
MSRSSPPGSGIRLRMGALICHLGSPMRAKRRRGPEQQKSQSRVHAGTSSVIAPIMRLRAIRRGNKRRDGSLEAQPLRWQADALADVKNRLSEVVDRLEREHGRVVMTKHGHPAAVVISVEDLESLEETLDVMGSAALLGDIRE